MVEDARYRTLYFINYYDVPANITKNDGVTQASYIVQFANAPYPLERVFYAPKNIDGVYSILSAESRGLPDYRHYTYAYEESVSIEIQTVTKQGIDGEKLRWKMEAELRRIIDNYPVGSLRSLTSTRPTEKDMGGWTVYGIIYTWRYVRFNDSYTSGVSISFGQGFMQDGDSVTGWIQTKPVTLIAGGYVSCIASDIGKMVTDDGGNLGLLVEYNNTTRVWMVAASATVTDASVMAITAGTGAGTSTASSVVTMTSLSGNGDNFDLYQSVGTATTYMSYPEEAGGTNLSLSSTVYTKIRYRYICSAAGMMARIVLVFSTWDYADTEAVNLAAGKGQVILAAGHATTYTVATVTITTAKTIDHVRLYVGDAVGHVYYEFIQIYKADFTFPNVETLGFTPSARNILIPFPSRVTDVTQNLGASSAPVEMTCNLDMSIDPTLGSANWKRPQTSTSKTDSDDGQMFMEIAHGHAVDQPWQWLIFGDHSFKVTLDEPRFEYIGDGHKVYLSFHEYSLSNKSNEYYYQRFGLPATP